MSRQIKLIIFLLFAIAAAGCNDKQSTSSEEFASKPAAATPAMDSPNEANNGPLGRGVDAKDDAKPRSARKLIQRVALSLKVESFTRAQQAIERQVKELGGFIASSQVEHGDHTDSANLTLRVPAKALDTLLTQAAGQGEVLREERSADDVTSRYVDTAARLATQRQLEKRLLEIAASGTPKVADLLEVERELARVRGEVERMEGQIKRWDRDVQFATVTVTLLRQPQVASVTLGNQMKNTFAQSLDAFGASGRALLIVLAGAAPWLLTLGLSLFGLRKFQLALRRRRGLTKQATAVNG